MKTVVMVFAFLVALVSVASAAGPYLVINPYSGADYFVVTGLPSSIPAASIPPESTGTFGFKLDISSLPPGSYSVTAQACSNIWGCSAYSPAFPFVKPNLGQAPAGFGLVVK